MKSKLRTIIVDGQAFKTNIRKVSPDFVCLRIWLPDYLSRPYAQVRYLFNDPWLYFPERVADGGANQHKFQQQPIKPNLIAKLIRQIVFKYGLQKPLKQRYNFELAEGGELAQIENALIPKSVSFDIRNS